MVVCDCVVAALVELALDAATEPGQHFACAEHGQVVVWDGASWKWSNQPEDFEQFPQMAVGDDSGPVSG